MKNAVQNINPHVVGDFGGAIGVTLVWLEHAPNIAAAMTVLWFTYRFIREGVKWIISINKE